MLPEDKRTQLDGIVQKMVQNKESDSNIRFVVDDFKQKYTTTETPIAKPEMPLLTDSQGGFGTALKDVAVGAGKSLIRGGRDIAGLAQSAGKGILGVFGADTSQMGIKSIDDNTPEGMQVAEQLKSKSRGEQVGTVLETIAELGTGFVKSGAQQALKTRQITKLAEKTKTHALDLVSPKATSEVSELAIKQGRVTEPGFLKKAKILPAKKEFEMADAVADVVSPKKTILQNTDAIDKKIRAINTGVKEYVSKNKVPFNTNQLKSQLNAGKDELKLVFASDKTAEKTYKAVVDEFMEHVGSKDTAGLLDARQSLDKIPAIKKLLDSRGLGENVKKEVVLTVRRMANKYIANLLPKGNVFRETLLKESRMIEAIGNIADKNKVIIGKNNLQILTNRYPVLKWVIGGTAAGLLGGAGVGVGSAIIGSTD
jgi:hypothetical protein